MTQLPPPATPLVAPHGGMDQRWYEKLLGAFSSLASTATGLAGLGTAAAKNVGTSGGTVPLLDTANDWSKQQTFPIQTLTEAEAVSGWDLETKQTATLTMTSSFMLGNALNAKPGTTYQLVVIAGAFVLTFDTMYKFPANGAVITTAGDCLFSLFCPAADVLWCVGVKEFA